MNYFDLHCDTATECYSKKQKLDKNNLAISLERGAHIKKWAQVYAIWIPDEYRGEAAYEYFNKVYNNFYQEIQQNSSKLALCLNMSEANAYMHKEKSTAFLAIEGGAAIAGKLSYLEEVYKKGIRMLTLTWNEGCEIGDGCMVPNASGLTPFGKNVVRKMDELKMVIDVSHLAEKGFWDVVKTSKKAFVATHSNSYEVAKHSRNLKDDQFKEIVQRGGLVGINFYPPFLKETGKATIEDIIPHIDHFLNLGGEDILAMGSDFDGAAMPEGIVGIEDVRKIYHIIEKYYGTQIADKLCFKNAQAFFQYRV